MPTATIRNVELVSAGTWPASSGPATITADDLDAILAASRDGLIDRAPIKFGHRSDLNEGIGDGAPAYGWVRPTKVTTGRNGLPTLLGDLEGIPAKIADVIRDAYPRRSAEILWNASTHAGKTYKAALKAVALLGASAPAVKGLADVAALYSEQANLNGVTSTVVVVDDDTDRLTLLAAALPAPDASHVPHPTLDPAKDGPMTNTTVNEQALRDALGLAADADLASALTAHAATLGTAPAAGTVNPDAEPTAAPATTPAAETPAVEQPNPDADPAKVVEEPAPQSEAAPTPAQQETSATEKTPGVVTLSEDTYRELTELAAQNRANRRAETVDAAIRAGKITPAERATYLSAMDTAEETTTTLLAALTPKFATVATGHAAAGDDSTPELDAALDRWAETGQF